MSGNVIKITDITESNRSAFSEAIECLQKSGRQLGLDGQIKYEIIQRIYKPYSEILKVRFFSSDSIVVFIKKLIPNDFLTSESMELDYNITKDLYARFSEYEDIEIVDSIAYYPDIDIIVTREIPGESLVSLTKRELLFMPGKEVRSRIEQLLYSCGKWLALMADFTSQDCQLIKTEMVTYNDLRLIEYENEKLRKRVLDFFDKSWNQLDPIQLKVIGVHGDFCLGNIFVTDRKVTVMDFTTYQIGSIYHDIVHLYYQLELFNVKPIVSGALICSMQKKIFEGYNSIAKWKIGVGDPLLDPMFRLYIIQRILCRISRIKESNHKCPLYERAYNLLVLRFNLKLLDRILEHS